MMRNRLDDSFDQGCIMMEVLAYSFFSYPRGPNGANEVTASTPALIQTRYF